MCSRRQEDRGDARQRIASGQDDFAGWHVIAEPAAEIGGAGVESVMQRVEADGEADSMREAVRGRKHARGVKNQQGVREIAGSKNSHADKQAAEGNRESLQSEQEGAFRGG